MTAKAKLATATKPFVSDGCSGIPDSSPKHRKCCDQHDFYYKYRGRFSWITYQENGVYEKPKEGFVSRRTADRLLRECLVDKAGEDKLWASFVYYAVRAFGWLAWYGVRGKVYLVLGLVALAAGLLWLHGCTTYQVEAPSGWKASISSVRKLDGAKVKATADGGLEVELNGVDTADPWRSLPQYLPYPYPIYPSPQTWPFSAPRGPSAPERPDVQF